MEELYEVIKNCENILYRGFLTAKASNVDWLNKCCGCMSELTKHLHKLILEIAKKNRGETIENIFLCIMNIVTGIKFMEKVIELEEAKDVVLTPSRQFFLDEILKSFQILKETASDIESGVFIAPEPTINQCIDTVLELLEPLCTFEEAKNVAERNANAMISVAKIKQLIESIVSHTLEFSSVCVTDDKTPISVICQKVLKECQALSDECSLSDPKKTPNDTNRRLKADLLESAVYQLENLINDSLLRLLIETFKDLKHFSIENLLKNDAEQDVIDTIIDRLFQIGRFGIMFADDLKISALIKHSLAAFEALESHLSPKILQKYDENHRFLLDSHWKEQTTMFQQNLQKIIDTSAFCSSFEEILDLKIQKLNENFDENILKNLLTQSEVLADHFRLNLTDHEMRPFTNDFFLMMRECHASLKLLNEIEPKRVIKRLKILKTTVKKVRESLKPKIIKVDEGNEEKTDEQVVKRQKVDDVPIKLLPEVEELIIVKEKSIEKPKLITNRDSVRKTRHTSYKFDPNISKIIQETKNNSVRNATTLKRRTSLRRMAMRNIESKTVTNLNLPKDRTLSLHITEILENITNVSSTFSTTRRLPEVEMSRSNKVRIHVIGEV